MSTKKVAAIAGTGGALVAGVVGEPGGQEIGPGQLGRLGHQLEVGGYRLDRGIPVRPGRALDVTGEQLARQDETLTGSELL
jgi:hypothetical protein